MMNFLRSFLHTAFMTVTVIPWASFIVLISVFAKPETIYRVAVAWLRLAIHSGTFICGIHNRVQGMDNLPADGSPGILLVKHQSVWETFAMPSLMPMPLAYVFKRELLYVPFFGWAMARLNMIHIDRSQRSEAFSKVVKQGRKILDQGIWIIMFPEGTRVDRGRVGRYKSGGTRLAVATGVPVVPVAMTAGRCWPRKAFVRKPGVVDFSIGPAIPSQGRDPEELLQEVEQWIEAEMRRLDPEAYRHESPAEAAH